jgi:hypothetical protein
METGIIHRISNTYLVRLDDSITIVAAVTTYDGGQGHVEVYGARMVAVGGVAVRPNGERVWCHHPHTWEGLVVDLVDHATTTTTTTIAASTSAIANTTVTTVVVTVTILAIANTVTDTTVVVTVDYPFF